MQQWPLGWRQLHLTAAAVKADLDQIYYHTIFIFWEISDWNILLLFPYLLSRALGLTYKNVLWAPGGDVSAYHAVIYLLQMVWWFLIVSVIFTRFLGFIHRSSADIGPWLYSNLHLCQPAGARTWSVGVILAFLWLSASFDHSSGLFLVFSGISLACQVICC